MTKDSFGSAFRISRNKHDSKDRKILYEDSNCRTFITCFEKQGWVRHSVGVFLQFSESQCVWKRVVQSIAFDELNVLVCNRNASCASGGVSRSGLEDAKASAEEELASTKTTLADDEKY